MSKNIPPYHKYMVPIFQVLKNLGGSATIQEMEEQVPELMKLTEEQLSVIHNPERGSQTEVGYRMAWARTYLKNVGIIENSERGVWALTYKGTKLDKIEPTKIVKQVRSKFKTQKEDKKQNKKEEEITNELDTESWKNRILEVVLNIPADAFERLCQRVLRECGFVEVKVLGRSGDGGIDGTGIIRLQNVVSYHVLFQSKRWKGTIPSKEIRDFRGAMVGRTDKGLFITTGSFTSDAKKEATRDGAPPIDLIDGERLAELLKQLKLGVETQLVEKTIVNDDWFNAI
jgi:restriction system protein